MADRHRSVVPWAWCKPKLAKARPLHFFKVKHHKIRQFKQVLLKGVIGTTAEHQQLTIVPDQSNWVVSTSDRQNVVGRLHLFVCCLVLAIELRHQRLILLDRRINIDLVSASDLSRLDSNQVVSHCELTELIRYETTEHVRNKFRNYNTVSGLSVWGWDRHKSVVCSLHNMHFFVFVQIYCGQGASPIIFVLFALGREAVSNQLLNFALHLCIRLFVNQDRFPDLVPCVENH